MCNDEDFNHGTKNDINSDNGDENKDVSADDDIHGDNDDDSDKKVRGSLFPQCRPDSS